MALRCMTEGSARLAVATISQVFPLTPTTTGLRLRIDDDAFTFQPGQWVDFHAPAVEALGGYSIVSLPSDLPMLDLAVKASAHPPAAWCTSAARAGDRVAVRVGGQFVLRHEATAALFVAGGVGINPLYSMLRSLLRERPPAADAAPPPPPTRSALLYTAQTRDELLFAGELESLARAHPEALRVRLGATREPAAALAEASAPRPGAVEWAAGRTDEAALEAALRWLGCEPNAALPRAAVPWLRDRAAPSARAEGTGACAGVVAYVCGPTRMTEETAAALRRMGVSGVYFEQWW